jgi:hypothetical protein
MNGDFFNRFFSRCSSLLRLVIQSVLDFADSDAYFEQNYCRIVDLITGDK